MAKVYLHVMGAAYDGEMFDPQLYATIEEAKAHIPKDFDYVIEQFGDTEWTDHSEEDRPDGIVSSREFGEDHSPFFAAYYASIVELNLPDA